MKLATLRQLLLCVLPLLAAPAPLFAQTRTLVAIVNRERPETNLGRNELVQIYRGEIRRWPNSRQIIQFALPPGSADVRNEFIRKILQMTPTDFDREWRGKRLRGESTLIPNPDLSRTEVMQAVATQRHFIAIVELEWLRSIDARFTRDVKILSIDGMAPDATGYPLRVSLARSETPDARAGRLARLVATH
jgi:hypothetical protein